MLCDNMLSSENILYSKIQYIIVSADNMMFNMLYW
jgi:hypothetical protein